MEINNLDCQGTYLPAFRTNLRLKNLFIVSGWIIIGVLQLTSCPRLELLNKYTGRFVLGLLALSFVPLLMLSGERGSKSPKNQAHHEIFTGLLTLGFFAVSAFISKITNSEVELAGFQLEVSLTLPLILSSMRRESLRMFVYGCMVVFYIFQSSINFRTLSARQISLNLTLFILYSLLELSQQVLQKRLQTSERSPNSSGTSMFQILNMLPHGVAVISEDSQLIMCNKPLRNSLPDFNEISLQKLLKNFEAIISLKFQEDSLSKERTFLQSFESSSKLHLHTRKSTLNRIISFGHKPSLLSPRHGANSSYLTDVGGPEFPVSTEEPLMSLGFENLRKLVEYMVQKMKVNIDQSIGWNPKTQEPEFIRLRGRQGRKETDVWVGYGNCDEKHQLIVVVGGHDRRVETRSFEKNQMAMLASVAHEFRTPLSGTMLMLEASMKDPRIPTDIKRNYLEVSLRSLQRLSFLINDILDMSQIRAQKIRIQNKSIEVVNLIEDVVKVISLQATMKGINFRYQIHTNVPKFLVSDENRLQQILINLLGNAIKFTFVGHVELLVQKNQQDPSLIEFRINDTGIGISEADQARLFHEYERLDSGASLNPNGVGLGLAISNTLVQLLGGTRIECKSKEGEGASFSFCIPYKSAENFPSSFSKKKASDASIKSLPKLGSMTLSRSRKKLDVIPERRRSTQSFSLMSLDESRNENLGHTQNLTRLAEIYVGGYIPSPKYRPEDSRLFAQSPGGEEYADVLIVDDDPFCVASLEAIIKCQGLTTMRAYNGEKAVEIIEDYVKNQSNEKIRLIFLDCEMPVIDGFKTCKIIKQLLQDNLGRTIPIVGCSGKSQVTEKVWRDTGMDDYVLKPLTADIIVEKLNTFLIQSSIDELLI